MASVGDRRMEQSDRGYEAWPYGKVDKVKGTSTLGLRFLGEVEGVMKVNGRGAPHADRPHCQSVRFGGVYRDDTGDR